MAEINPYAIEEITPDKAELFINREGELRYVIDSLINERYVAIPVLGDIGTGKTSFLNMVKYELEKEGIRAKIISADDILQNRVTENGFMIVRDGTTRSDERWDVLLVDNIEKLGEKEAMEVYRTMLKMRSNVKMLFTGREDWSKDIKEVINWLSTDLAIDVKATPEDMAYFMEERLKRAGVENRFDKEALILAGERANQNLREFFKYCRLSARLKREGEITREVMKDIIIAEDLSQISMMDDLTKGIVISLIMQGEMTNQKLMKSLKEMLGGFKDSRYYEAREYLRKKGFIKVENEGFRVILKDVYRALGIEISKEMMRNPGLYVRKIRDKYVREWAMQ